MMGFNKALADGAVTLFEIEVAGLAARAVEFFRLLGRGAVALNFAMEGIFAGLDNGGLSRDFEFILQLGLRFDIALDTKQAPKTTNSFAYLAEEGFYNDLTFHRIVPGFVIQGGDGQYGRVRSDGKLAVADLAKVGSGTPGYTIADDPPRTDYTRGTVAMARTGDPHSEAAQFFIVLGDGPDTQSLSTSNPYGYAIIGSVTSGMDAVDAIAAMPNTGDPNNAAIDPVPMTAVTVGP